MNVNILIDQRESKTPLTFSAYAYCRIDTAVYPQFTGVQELPITTRVTDGHKYLAMKLCGEAGEVTELIAKAMRDEHYELTPERREKLKLELGDVLWYIDALACELGYRLEEVAEANIQKLVARKERNTIHGSGDDR